MSDINYIYTYSKSLIMWNQCIWLVILTIAFVTRIATVTWFKGWCNVSPLWSHLWAMWAMKPLWSTATIEIHPHYKDPCHCKNWLATSTILWLPTIMVVIPVRWSGPASSQVASNPKVNHPEPLSLQVVCNQGNHLLLWLKQVTDMYEYCSSHGFITLK